jgi:putative endonuclease
MTHTAIGQQAEAAAAHFLERKGCRIVERNWRTPRCEIDIVAERRNVLYVCEVKYRLTAAQGLGLDYITTTKLKQMRFAAESWVYDYRWNGEYVLCAIEVTGPGFTVTAAIKI